MEKKYGPQKKYQEKHKVKTYLLVLFDTEQDIVDHLAKAPNVSGYIKALIRADLERRKILKG